MLIYFFTGGVQLYRLSDIRDGPFDIRGGGLGFFLKKIVCFPTDAKKIKCLQPS